MKSATHPVLSVKLTMPFGQKSWKKNSLSTSARCQQMIQCSLFDKNFTQKIPLCQAGSCPTFFAPTSHGCLEKQVMNKLGLPQNVLYNLHLTHIYANRMNKSYCWHQEDSHLHLVIKESMSIKAMSSVCGWWNLGSSLSLVYQSMFKMILYFCHRNSRCTWHLIGISLSFPTTTKLGTEQ